jgi:drug/metabolite transporter (DMT)-like permease
MWQTDSLLATASQCLENITDKRAMRDEIDGDVASFIRVLLYCLLVVPITSLIGSSVTWHISVGIILFGFASAVMSSAYTQVLKRVDVTTIAVLTYIGPLLFLAIDAGRGHSFSSWQIAGLIGLVVGGIGFVFDGRLKADRMTFAMLGVMFTYSGIEFYYLQYVNRTTGISGISFFASVWAWACAFLLLNLVLRKKWRMLTDKQARQYAALSVVGKSFDVGSSYFSGLALTATTVAQFSAMQVFYPPMMLMLAMTVQHLIRIDLGEQITRTTFARKAGMAVLLVISGKLV